MEMDFLETSEFTAIRIYGEPSEGYIRIGVLILEPTDKDILDFKNFQIYLTDDLRNKKGTITVCEREFEVVSD